MLNDQAINPLPGQVLLEPQRTEILGVLDETVPPTMRGRLIKVGPDCAKFVAGLRVLFVPHGGTLLTVPKGDPERMILPIYQIIGTIED